MLPGYHMLSGMANYFGVTVDALLGIGELRDSGHLRCVFTRKYELEVEGHYAVIF